MIPRGWSLPSAWEEDVPAGGGSSDILAEERERRLLRRRGIRALWPGNWLTGRTGVLALGLFLAAGAGWFALVQGNGSSRASEVSLSHESSGPGRVRGLSAGEHSLASRYGTPLYLGPEGRPVVEMESTGAVRELTPFEMELDAPVSRLPSARGPIVQVPGPRGWGMWWLDNSGTASMQPALSFDRLSWRERQERELARVVRGAALGMVLMDGLDMELWERGLGIPLLELASRIREPYPPARLGRWAGVPGLWVCGQDLEFDLHQGVAAGCPGSDYDQALRDAWTDAGSVVERLEGIGRYVSWMDGMDSAELHGSGAMVELSYEAVDLVRDFRDLERSLARLREVSREWGLSIAVDAGGGS